MAILPAQEVAQRRQKQLCNYDTAVRQSSIARASATAFSKECSIAEHYSDREVAKPFWKKLENVWNFKCAGSVDYKRRKIFRRYRKCTNQKASSSPAMDMA